MMFLNKFEEQMPSFLVGCLFEAGGKTGTNAVPREGDVACTVPDVGWDLDDEEEDD